MCQIRNALAIDGHSMALLMAICYCSCDRRGPIAAYCRGASCIPFISARRAVHGTQTFGSLWCFVCRVVVILGCNKIRENAAEEENKRTEQGRALRWDFDGAGRLACFSINRMQYLNVSSKSSFYSHFPLAICVDARFETVRYDVTMLGVN
jgi:hypothetical protein